MVRTPRPSKKRSNDNKDKGLEYDAVLEENRTIFNYEIKKHGDKKEEYHSNCIKATELLWWKCSKMLKARIEVEIKGSFTTTMDTVKLLKWIEDSPSHAPRSNTICLWYPRPCYHY